MKINTTSFFLSLISGMIFMIFSCKENDNIPFNHDTGSFTDARDGKTYKTIKIGDQWIMAENFAFKPEQGNYWAYNNDSGNVAIYGYLYDLETAKRIAPDGWHLPTKNEWKIFRKSLGARMDLWFTMHKVYNQMITGGSSGFDAKFGGAYIITYGEFRGLGDEAYFWSSTETSDGPANFVLERERGEAFLSDYADPRGGKSVRFFKD